MKILDGYLYQTVTKQQDDTQEAKDQAQTDNATQDTIAIGSIKGYDSYFLRATCPDSVTARTIKMMMKVIT